MTIFTCNIPNRAVLSMLGRKLLLLGLLVPPALMAAEGKTAPAGLTAEQIVEKHVAARGGLQTWRAVQAMSLTGKLDAGGGSGDRVQKIAAIRKGRPVRMKAAENKDAETKAEPEKQMQLPITLELKRPNKSRVEIGFAGKTAVQVFDGTNGWKLRPYLNRKDVEPFTAEEAKFEAGRAGLDGSLVDYAAKGTRVELEAIEPVEGHDAYKLKLTMKNGDVQHIWIDAQSFLDVKIEGIPRRMDGNVRNVWVYQRDFRPVQGVMIPFVLEAAVEGYPETHKMVIEKAALNPALDDALFAKPGA